MYIYSALSLSSQKQLDKNHENINWHQWKAEISTRVFYSVRLFVRLRQKKREFAQLTCMREEIQRPGL